MDIIKKQPLPYVRLYAHWGTAEKSKGFKWFRFSIKNHKIQANCYPPERLSSFSRAGLLETATRPP